MGQSDLRIGELADLAGVSTRTIRHYEEHGLLRPSRRSGNGYRRYDVAALLELAEIRRLRAIGLSLADIAALHSDTKRTGDGVSLLDRLRVLDEHLGKEAAALDARRDTLSRLRDSLERGEPILTAREPESFGEVRTALRAAGASSEAIDEERRVWAVLDAIELPLHWRAVIDAGLAQLSEDPSQFAYMAEILEEIAAIRDLPVDDPRVDAAAERMTAAARASRADLPVSLFTDPAIGPILHAVASGFSPAQHKAMAAMVLAVAPPRT